MEKNRTAGDERGGKDLNEIAWLLLLCRRTLDGAWLASSSLSWTLDTGEELLASYAPAGPKSPGDDDVCFVTKDLIDPSCAGSVKVSYIISLLETSVSRILNIFWCT